MKYTEPGRGCKSVCQEACYALHFRGVLVQVDLNG